MGADGALGGSLTSALSRHAAAHREGRGPHPTQPNTITLVLVLRENKFVHTSNIQLSIHFHCDFVTGRADMFSVNSLKISV